MPRTNCGGWILENNELVNRPRRAHNVPLINMFVSPLHLLSKYIVTIFLLFPVCIHKNKL